MTPTSVIELVSVATWFLAGLIALYFSLGSARIWTAISTGFLLVFVSEGYRLYPWVSSPRLVAVHLIVGTIAILVLAHGFQEYYVFSRTLEASGRKASVYLATAAAIVASYVFLLINPEPSPAVVRHIGLVANVNWVFLTLINIDITTRIYAQVRGTRVASGFLAFLVVFVCLFLWRGAELYLQVYAWDEEWRALSALSGAVAPAPDLWRIRFAEAVHRAAGLMSSLSVGATFIYLYRLLR